MSAPTSNSVLAYVKLNFWNEFLWSTWAHSPGCARGGFCVSSLKRDSFGYPTAEHTAGAAEGASSARFQAKFWFVEEALHQNWTCCNTSLLRQRGTRGRVSGAVWEPRWVAQEGAVVQRCRGSMQVLGAQSALLSGPRKTEVKEGG